MTPSRACRALPAVCAVLLLITGCGARIDPASRSDTRQTTITNCGEQVSYPVPQRAVAYDVSGAEKMFALGLAGRMRGYVMNSLGDPSIAGSPWQADYRTVPRLGSAQISKEIVVAAKADWVLAGWNSGFSEERGITPDLLARLGVRSYLHSETCWDYAEGKADLTPLRALYTDLRNIGAIFGVAQRAERLVAGLQDRFQRLRAQAPGGKAPARVFVYDSGTDQPFTAGRHAAPNDIIAAAGGRNVFESLNDGWGTVGWEPVVKARPEAIVIVDYADQPAADKIAFLKSLPQLASTPAVRDNRFHVLSYGELVSGPRNADAAESLAGYLRSIGR